MATQAFQLPDCSYRNAMLSSSLQEGIWVERSELQMNYLDFAQNQGS
jgi:hypothetical protein